MKLPKAVRGVSYKGHTRINRVQLAKLFRDPAFRFTGFIVGNNVNPFHFFGGWHLAHRVEGRDKAEMDVTINGFAYYLDPELGNNVAIFVKPSAIRRAQDPTFVPSLPLL